MTLLSTRLWINMGKSCVSCVHRVPAKIKKKSEGTVSHQQKLDQWIKTFINEKANIKKINISKTKQIWDEHKQCEAKYRGEQAKDPGNPKLKFRGFVHFNENGIIDNIITQDPNFIEKHHETFFYETGMTFEQVKADGVKVVKEENDDICDSDYEAKDKWIGFQIQFKYGGHGKLQKINILPGSNTFGYAHPSEKDDLKKAVIEYTGLQSYLEPKSMCQLMTRTIPSSQMDIEITCEYKEKKKKN